MGVADGGGLEAEPVAAAGVAAQLEGNFSYYGHIYTGNVFAFSILYYTHNIKTNQSQ